LSVKLNIDPIKVYSFTWSSSRCSDRLTKHKEEKEEEELSNMNTSTTVRLYLLPNEMSFRRHFITFNAKSQHGNKIKIMTW